jgi:hypothetical protein
MSVQYWHSPRCLVVLRENSFVAYGPDTGFEAGSVDRGDGRKCIYHRILI